jgi:Cu(I)/Ag(I) efflux system membrane fusion protein
MNETNRPATRGSKLWTALKILNVRLRFILLMVVTGLIAANWDSITAHWERWTRPHPAATTAAAVEYYCPMHPSVVRGEPGNCPICGMPLSRRERGEAAALPEGVIARVQLTPYRMALAGVATSAVEYRVVDRVIRAAGTISADEGRVASISARVGGRIEKLVVDFTGQTVALGDALAEIYSPDLIATQQEYLTALRQPQARQAGLVDAARTRLRLWGVADDQIADLERRGEPPRTFTLRAPIGGVVTRKTVQAGQYVAEGTELYTVTDLARVWANAFVYENDLASVRVGQAVEVTSRALPDRRFAGRVAFIALTLDPETRTAQVRVDVPNPDQQLRPGMYVDMRIELASAASATGAPATVKYTCPMDPEIVSDQPGSCPICGMNLEKVETPAVGGGSLVVPESAVVDNGTQRVVYLEREPGVFDAVALELGPVAEGYYPVLSGLIAGDRVVTQGAFLVDAEVRLNPAAAGSYFGASGGPSAGPAPMPAGHRH